MSWTNPFKQPPDAPPVSPEAVPMTFRYWRARLLSSTFVGYAVYYFVRKNLPVALPLMEKDLGISKVSFGTFYTLHDLMYGFSKLCNGLLADRTNPRALVSLGLLLSGLINLAFGMNSAALVLGILWVLNGYVQGAGFPPCARILAYWFSPSERGLTWGIFNTSHQVGAAIILVASGYLGTHCGWRACFIVPALIAVGTSFFLYNRVRDTPASLGLPSVEVFRGESVPAPRPEARPVDAGKIIWERVYKNPIVWLVSVGNFLVYVVRYGVLNWAPTYLVEVKHASLTVAANTTACFELAGLAGSLLAGWATDRFFGARRAPVCVLCMVLSTFFVVLFWKTPGGNPWLDMLALAGIGFGVYGPQFLVGVLVADQATKRAAGSAVGLSGFLGYLSGVVSGFGLGKLVTLHGWDAGFLLIACCSALGILPFLLCWNARPHPEQD